MKLENINKVLFFLGLVLIVKIDPKFKNPIEVFMMRYKNYLKIIKGKSDVDKIE